ncbi:MAG: 4a-hydroxytetrahydrobiopterin dehydratase [Solirubrobacteraceae bacterium]
MASFTEETIKENLPTWYFNHQVISKKFIFKDFKSAFAFMVKVAFYAEIQNHHPDWTNSYNTVIINLTTHDQKKITEKDIKLAKAIDAIII